MWRCGSYLHASLLYYIEGRWLSRAKGIPRIHEVKVEITIFMEQNQNDAGNMLSEYDIFLNKPLKVLLALAKSYL